MLLTNTQKLSQRTWTCGVSLIPTQPRRSCPHQLFSIRLGESEPSIWPHLHRIWSHTASAHDVLDADDQERRITLRKLCYSTARFTRNLVAAVPKNQDRALFAKFYDILVFLATDIQYF